MPVTCRERGMLKNVTTSPPTEEQQCGIVFAVLPPNQRYYRENGDEFDGVTAVVGFRF